MRSRAQALFCTQECARGWVAIQLLALATLCTHVSTTTTHTRQPLTQTSSVQGSGTQAFAQRQIEFIQLGTRKPINYKQTRSVWLPHETTATRTNRTVRHRNLRTRIWRCGSVHNSIIYLKSSLVFVCIRLLVKYSLPL